MAARLTRGERMARRADDRRRLVELRRVVAEAKRDRTRRLVAVRQECKRHREAITATAKARRAMLRDDTKALRVLGRSTCRQNKRDVADDLASVVTSSRTSSSAIRDEGRRALAVDRGGKGSAGGRRAAELRSESDDAVRNELDPRWWPVWDARKHKTKATARTSRAEVFAEWMTEHAGEVNEILNRHLEAELDELQAQERTLARELERGDRYAAGATHEDEDDPFGGPDVELAYAPRMAAHVATARPARIVERPATARRGFNVPFDLGDMYRRGEHPMLRQGATVSRRTRNLLRPPTRADRFAAPLRTLRAAPRTIAQREAELGRFVELLPPTGRTFQHQEQVFAHHRRGERRREEDAEDELAQLDEKIAQGLADFDRLDEDPVERTRDEEAGNLDPEPAYDPKRSIASAREWQEWNARRQKRGASSLDSWAGPGSPAISAAEVYAEEARVHRAAAAAAAGKSLAREAKRTGRKVKRPRRTRAEIKAGVVLPPGAPLALLRKPTGNEWTRTLDVDELADRSTKARAIAINASAYAKRADRKANAPNDYTRGLHAEAAKWHDLASEYFRDEIERAPGEAPGIGRLPEHHAQEARKELKLSEHVGAHALGAAARQRPSQQAAAVLRELRAQFDGRARIEDDADRLEHAAQWVASGLVERRWSAGDAARRADPDDEEAHRTEGVEARDGSALVLTSAGRVISPVRAGSAATRKARKGAPWE